MNCNGEGREETDGGETSVRLKQREDKERKGKRIREKSGICTRTRDRKGCRGRRAAVLGCTVRSQPRLVSYALACARRCFVGPARRERVTSIRRTVMLGSVGSDIPSGPGTRCPVMTIPYIPASSISYR